MIAKFFSVFVVFALLTVQTQASTQNGLKAAFDELNYSLTVEWDQKDKSFHDAKVKEFTKTLRELQQKGLTNAQMIEFAKNEIKDKKIAKDLETAFTMIQINKMNASEANKYILDVVKNSYSSGASWVGDALLYIGAGVLVVAIAVAIGSGTTVQTGGGYGCYYQDVYVCDDYCSYDYWGYYSCWSDCYWTSYCY